MRRTLTTAAILLLGSVTLSWAMPVQGEGPRGATAFAVYCADCHGLEADGEGPRAAALRHRPADLRRLEVRYGTPLPWSLLAPRVDPPPDVLELPADHACNERLVEDLSLVRFAWRIRRATLYEIFTFLDSRQRSTSLARGPGD